MPLCLVQAWLLALLAAQKDERLALLRLGHLHHQGLHGLPTDPDLAYAYYANIAKQTTLDRLNPTPQQVVEVLVTALLCSFRSSCLTLYVVHFSVRVNNNLMHGIINDNKN